MKKQMRKLLVIWLAALMCSACGGSKKQEATVTETEVVTEAVTEVPTEATTEPETKTEMDQSVLYGIWAVDAVEVDGSKYSRAELEAANAMAYIEFYLVFKEGGSVYIQMQEDQGTAAWTMDADNTVTMGSITCTYIPEEEALVSNTNSEIIYFHKISDSQDITDIPAITVPETVTSETEAPAKDDGEVSADFKKMMDEYEGFFDKYVEFMKNYQKSDNPMGMMMDYLQMLTDYSEAMEALGDMKSEDMSAADYAYYIDTMARIEKKLLEAY